MITNISIADDSMITEPKDLTFNVEDSSGISEVDSYVLLNRVKRPISFDFGLSRALATSTINDLWSRGLNSLEIHVVNGKGEEKVISQTVSY